MFATRSVDWSYDRRAQKLTLYELRDYEIASIAPHALGLKIDTASTQTKRASVVPGEYSLDAVAMEVGAAWRLRSSFVAELLELTEIWERRGFHSDARVWPAKFFELVTLHDWLAVPTKSYRRWYLTQLASAGRELGISKRSIKQKLEKGRYPERLHGVPKWTSLDLVQLCRAVLSHAHEHERWALFATQYLASYGTLLDRLPAIWREIDAFIDAVLSNSSRSCMVELADSMCVLACRQATCVTEVGA